MGVGDAKMIKESPQYWAIPPSKFSLGCSRWLRWTGRIDCVDVLIHVEGTRGVRVGESITF